MDLEYIQKIDQIYQQQLIQNELFKYIYSFTYGTSGFRMNSSLLPYVVFWLSIFCNVFWKYLKSKTMGVMFTASHNSFQDNGVKIIMPNGEMLGLEDEKILTKFVNEKDLTIAIEYLNNMYQHDSCFQFQQSKILIGHDTWPSGLQLIQVFKEGFKDDQEQIINFEYITTPQLYFYVYHWNQSIQKETFLIQQEVIQLYESLFIKQFQSLAICLNKTNEKQKILFDFANGIGYNTLKNLLNKLDNNFEYSFINIPQENNFKDLNLKCGAEYVQKKNLLPENAANINQYSYGVSFDGDADRIILFFKENDHIRVIDGDNMVALICVVLKKIFQTFFLENLFQENFKIVLTQYSNKGLMWFLEYQQVPFEFVPTGVKHTHHKATLYPISCYFEPNGHGTLLIQESLLEVIKKKISNKQQQKCYDLLAFCNSLTGDAIFNFFQFFLHMQFLNLSIKDFYNLFEWYKHLTWAIWPQSNIEIVTNEITTKTSSPVALSDLIEKTKQDYKENDLKIYIRKSGTENVIRVHLEWKQNKDQEFPIEILKKIFDDFFNKIQ